MATTEIDRNTDTELPLDAATNGAVLFIPLNKLKKSPRNARKSPHGEAHIEALAASIAAKGLLQNLVVEPERDAGGEPTGNYFVTIGEGRRLAHLLRVKRKEIKKIEPVRCILDITNDAHEISLDENVTREAMHPADQFEAFRRLAEDRGFGAEEIAARFGVSAHVVKQRLRLGAVSPTLMQIYRDGGLSLDQLMAFAITEDHTRQEQVYETLSWNREPSTIRRELTKADVPATDRRAIFVGAETYMAAGGSILRDLFTDDRGGYFENVALLDRLVIEKLGDIAETLRTAEGWKWTTVHIDYPHAHGMRRIYPQPVEISHADVAAHDAAKAEYDRLTAEFDGYDELPDEIDARFGELETVIERIEANRHAYEPSEIARSGAFVLLSFDGTARIERGFVRSEDELPEPTQAARGNTTSQGIAITEDGEIIDDADESPTPALEEETDGVTKTLSDLLIRDLTAHRTLGLRLALGDHPEIALIAVVHALAAQTFYRGGNASCLDVRATSSYLAPHAEGIEDTAAAKLLADRHAEWASDLPRDVADLWDFVAGLDPASRMALLAHCAALSIDVVKIPWERKPQTEAMAEKLADAVGLDMTTHWIPTTASYFGRITKTHILAAVREAVGHEAADRIAGLKKQQMADAAGQLLRDTGWLPPLLRTTRTTDAESLPETQAALQAAE